MLQLIVLATSTLNVQISAAPLDIDSGGLSAGANVIRGVPVRDWGVTASGRAYYQQGGADLSEAAAFGYDSDSGALSLMKG